MSRVKNNQFIEVLKKYGIGNKIQLPEHIDFEFINDVVKITLPADAVGKNMQTDDAAFEGWTLVIYSLLSKADIECKMVLDIHSADKNGVTWEEIGQANAGHHNRFLYRLMKFVESYTFVEITAELKKHLGEYYYKKDNSYHRFDDSTLYVNKPTTEASCNRKEEMIVEKKFSEFPDALIDKTESIYGITMQREIHRQLPVGIFKDEVKKENAIFTGGASAVDLWGLADDNRSLCIYELKVKENAKVGIISELFFYSNLMYDLYGNNSHFKTTDDGKSDYRGYDKLKNLSSIEKVYAVFLVERMHPLIDNHLVQLLTQDCIKYTIMEYKYSCNISL